MFNTELTREVKRPGHIFTLSRQAVKRSGGIGRCLCDDFDLMVFQCLPNGVRYPHISGITRADDQNLRSGGQNIINQVFPNAALKIAFQKILCFNRSTCDYFRQ